MPGVEWALPFVLIWLLSNFCVGVVLFSFSLLFFICLYTRVVNFYFLSHAERCNEVKWVGKITPEDAKREIIPFHCSHSFREFLFLFFYKNSCINFARDHIKILPFYFLRANKLDTSMRQMTMNKNEYPFREEKKEESLLLAYWFLFFANEK